MQTALLLRLRATAPAQVLWSVLACGGVLKSARWLGTRRMKMSLVDFVELSKASGVRSLACSLGYVLARFSCSMMAASSTGAVRESMVVCLRRKPRQLHLLCLHKSVPCMVLYFSDDLLTNS